MSTEFDVVLLGAGPGGSAAAKKCAEGGLNTLLIQKQRLPGDKVCAGGLSNAVQRLVKETFGDLPESVLIRPPYVMGIQFHVLGLEPITLEHRGPLVWRKDFDFWLNRIAQRAGAQLWEANKVRGITEDVQGYVLHVGEGDRKRHVTTRFLIGADGALSVVRRALFEQIKMKFQIAIRYCYRGSLNLNPDYLHYFALPDLPFLKSISRMMFFCWRLPQTLPNY